MKLIYTLLVVLLPLSVFSQPEVQFSDDIDVPDLGWNKVLMMRNGNTVLFHFEPRKHISVRVFDKNRKGIASYNCLTKILDLNYQDQATIKGIYDINGDAVVFAEQPVFNKNSLIRLRFDATTGKLIEEKIALQSSSFDNKNTYTVLKAPATDSYAVFCFKYNIIMHPDNKNDLVLFNEKNENYKIISTNINNKVYKDINMLSANVDRNGGICITMHYSNEKITGTSAPSIQVNSSTVYNRYLVTCYKAKDADTLSVKMVEMAPDMVPDYVLTSYNPFAKSINLLVSNSRSSLQQFGFRTVSVINKASLFIAYSTADMQAGYNWVNYDKVNETFQRVGNNSAFYGNPLHLFTNEYGLTTLVAERYLVYSTVENNGMTYPCTFFGDIAISQFDDNGKELWGTVLPKAAYLEDYVYGEDLVLRGKAKALFRSKNVYAASSGSIISKLKYTDQFASVSSYYANKNYYFVYNDYPKNFSNSLGKPGDPVYKYELTDAFYYRMDKKREIKKNYLFGPSAENESRSVFLESADFDEKTSTYSALVFHRKGESYTIQLAWCHLD